VVELHKYASRLIGELCQHGALILVEVIAGHVRSMERKGNAAESVADRDRDDRPHQPIRQVISRGRLSIDAEGAARPHRLEHRVTWIERSCRRVIPALVLRTAVEDPTLFAKDARGGEAERAMRPVDKMAFDLRKIPCVQNGVAETFSRLGDGAIEIAVREMDG
jgi:hypothetical protein